MNFAKPMFFRCLKKHRYEKVIVGEVYPGWQNRDGSYEIAIDEHSTLDYAAGEIKQLQKDFADATSDEFEASITKAMQGVDSIRQDQIEFGKELSQFNTALLGSGGSGAPESTSTQLITGNPAGQLRNRAHSLKRKADSLAELVKSKKEWLEAKLGQKMALAMASLADMQGVVAKLEEVVYTVQLYLGRDEEVKVLRDGPAATAETPVCIRQNVLYMDEECALKHSNGIDCDEIEKFDEWIIERPENLQQVFPEPKGVVVLQVRRYDKQYRSENIAEALMNAAKSGENKKTYFLIRNGERLRRIWADIQVGERLIPRQDEVDHFFFESDNFRKDKSAQQVPLRAGSREFLEAMEKADAVRRHYMRLMLVLQGLIDRTQLFAPYPEAGRPNLLDPDAWTGRVHFLRDVEGVLTDGKPSFSDWLEEVNKDLQHGYRIVGRFPTSFYQKYDETRIHPSRAQGVNDEDVHTVIELNGELRFSFKRSDTVWRRGYYEESGPAKTSGSYKIYRSDTFFVCVDNAKIEDMEYYINDRRHRKDYEHMVPSLQRAIAFLIKQAEEEKPFRDLLLNKLNEAVPGAECTPEQLDRLIRWWKTKTREHRALLADDGKAFRMIMARYVAQAASPERSVNDELMRQKIALMPNALFGFHVGDSDYNVLLSIDGEPYFVREETWRVEMGVPHLVATKPYVIIAQKAYYETFPNVYRATLWDARPPILNPKRFLSPELRPAVVEFVRENQCSRRSAITKEGAEELIAVYFTSNDDGDHFVAASVEYNPDRSGGFSFERDPVTVLDDMKMPSFTEKGIRWSGASPKFEYNWRSRGGSSVNHKGEIQLDWEDEDDKHVGALLYIDKDVMEKLKKAIPSKLAHNRRSRRMSDWTYSCSSNATAALKKRWSEKHFAKYLSEQGDPEFFEDHLKTLKEERSDTRFIHELARAAVEAGHRPKELCEMTIAEFTAKFKGEDITPDAETLARLVEAGWKLPPLKPAKAEKPDDDDD